MGGGGETHELLAASGGRRKVVNAAPSRHFRFQDATRAGQVVGHGCQHLQRCDWLQVQLLQQGGDGGRIPAST